MNIAIRSFAQTILFSALLLLTGCAPGTKFSGTSHCPSYLSDGDVILVSALRGNNQVLQLDAIRKKMSGRNVKVHYAPEEEYNLRAAGVTNPLDTAFYPTLLRNGITHLLQITPDRASSGRPYDYKTPYELSLELNPFHPSPPGGSQNVYKSVVTMHLISLKTKQYYAFKIESQIHGLEVRHDDGGRSNVNAGSVDQAMYYAVKKGADKISENCR